VRVTGVRPPAVGTCPITVQPKDVSDATQNNRLTGKAPYKSGANRLSGAHPSLQVRADAYPVPSEV